MFKLHSLAGRRHCMPISHSHIRSLTILLKSNGSLGLDSVPSHELNQFSVPHSMCRKTQKYSVNESCYIRRNSSSNVKKPSFDVSMVKKFPLDANLPKNTTENEPVGTGASKQRRKRNSRPDRLYKHTVSSADVSHLYKHTVPSVDESFLEELLGEYEVHKSALFKDTLALPPHDASHGSATTKASSTKSRDDGDVFGTVAGVLNDVPDFEADEEDEERLAVLPPLDMRERQAEYTEKIQALCREGNLRGAFTMLEEEMREEKVKPIPYHYRILIGACAKIGLVDEAFRLFAQLKNRGYPQKPLLYSYMFIACTNSKNPSEHLQRITDLRTKMAEQQIELSVMNYHAMLLAFGRCGALETAFELFDEMLSSSKRMVSTRTFNCLMTSCISDREVGFRYAIELCQKMHELKLKPDIYTFNLLLRCAVECKSGDPDLLLELFRKMSVSNSLPVNLRNTLKKERKALKISAGSSPCKLEVVDVLVKERDSPISRDAGNKVYFQDWTSSELVSNELKGRQRNTKNARSSYFEDDYMATNHENENNSSSSQLEKGAGSESEAPYHQGFGSLKDDSTTHGLITEPAEQRVAQQTHQHSVPANSTSEDIVTALLNADEPPQRLRLLGGLSGVLDSMAAQRVRPNMKTFLTLLWALPDTLCSEQELLQAMKDVSVTPNTTFCNMLIKKRSLRGEYALAKNALFLMSEHRLAPDIITYGCLALGCRTYPDAKELLRTISEQGGCPNVIIMLNLIRNAVGSRQYDYCRKLFNPLQMHRIEPHPEMFELFEDARTQAIADLKQLERDDSVQAETEIRARKMFLSQYTKWLKKAPSPKKARDKKDGRPDVASMLL